MSRTMTNSEVALLLRQMAAIFEVKGDDFFRVRAYQNAASSIEHTGTSLKDLWEENQLDSVPGVGPNIQQHLDELFRTGKVRHFEQEAKGLPSGMFVLMSVPGVGPKTAFKLASAFDLTHEETALEKLKQAAEKGQIRDLEGFGEESEKQILEGINQRRPHENRLLMPEAEELAGDIIAYLLESPDVVKAEALGSLRRRSSTIGDIDIAVATKQPEKVMDFLKSYKGLGKILSTGPMMTSFVHKSGRQIDVKTQEPQRWGSMLQHYTGSKLHNIHLRTYAKDKKMSLSEYGIKKGEKTHEFSTEKDFYGFLGLEYIPPELREDNGEIPAALTHKLPHLVELSDIKGDLHIHTDFDIQTSHDLGASTIKELIAQAHILGYEYIGLTDHNPKLKELTAAARLELIKKRNEAIDQQNSSYENEMKTRVPKILKGLEVDIRPDGTLALEDQALELLDYAIVSIHSQFTQTKEKATARVLAALKHPKVRILGHPTGRMLQVREGLDYDWDQLFEYCQKNDIFMEINASPQRLDLSDTLIRAAIKQGVQMVIDTDSHAASHMQGMKYGVWNARRGWAQPKDIANTLSLLDLKRKMIK